MTTPDDEALELAERILKMMTYQSAASLPSRQKLEIWLKACAIATGGLLTLHPVAERRGIALNFAAMVTDGMEHMSRSED